MYRLRPESKALCGALTGKVCTTFLLGYLHDNLRRPGRESARPHVFALGSDRALIGAAGQFDLAEQLAGRGVKDAEGVVNLGSGEKPFAVCLDCYAVYVWPDV